VHRSRFPFRRLAAAAALLLAARVCPAWAQQPAAADSAAPAPAPAPAQLPTGPLLDAPVSRSEYLLGPGDVVDVAIFGETNRLTRAAVTPEGTLVLPEIGVARVLGLNLDQAQQRVAQLVYRYYHNVDVTLTLAQVRTFKVFVVGDVPNPGERTASAATRVSEVLPPAADNTVNRRNVLLRRASGDTLVVDLARFRQSGDLSANPTLREGDRVLVPTVDRTVVVFGRVRFPGTYEYRPGESLAELLSVANGAGPFPADAADSLRLTRFLASGVRSFGTLTREEAMGPQGHALLLQPFDAVYVPAVANYRLQRTARVDGQVVHPGVYPIRPDTTTVRELVAMAGGFTDQASLVGAVLRRRVPPEPARNQEAIANLPPDVLSGTEERVRATRTLSDPSLVAIDFERLFAGGSNGLDQPLRDGDVLTVPERGRGVTVLGAVQRPGIVAYAPGLDPLQYVALAGGYSRRADWRHTTVVRARDGSMADLREARVVDEGDQVVVPFRTRAEPLQRLQTLQAVVGIVSGLVLTVLTVSRVF
jgi:polysaccharide biosynthesis/export protein